MNIPVFLFFIRLLLISFVWLADSYFISVLQINGASESVLNPTDVLFKTNGPKSANKEGTYTFLFFSLYHLYY
jgi:hypothetical protein